MRIIPLGDDGRIGPPTCQAYRCRTLSGGSKVPCRSSGVRHPCPGLALAAALLLAACSGPDPPRTYLPPPTFVDLRVPEPPPLSVPEEAIADSPAAYPSLVAEILAAELAPVFDLSASGRVGPDGAARARRSAVMNAVTRDLVIPILFDSLTEAERTIIGASDLQISLGNADETHALIVDAAMARTWLAISGETRLHGGYLQHIAARPDDPPVSFIAFSGLDPEAWQALVARRFEGVDHPFFLLGATTTRHLHAHVFSMIGFMVAEALAETLIRAEHADEARSEVDARAAELMVRAGLPLLGVDTIYALLHEGDPTLAGIPNVAFPSCRRQHFFARSKALYEDGADDGIAAMLAARTRAQEEIANRRLAKFMVDPDQPIRYAHFSAAEWQALTAGPAIGCEPASVTDLRTAALTPSRGTTTLPLIRMVRLARQPIVEDPQSAGLPILRMVMPAMRDDR
jgi:hypothetical protein